MKTYVFEVYELHSAKYRVENASSIEEAIERFQTGDASCDDDGSEFIETMDDLAQPFNNFFYGEDVQKELFAAGYGPESRIPSVRSIAIEDDTEIAKTESETK